MFYSNPLLLSSYPFHPGLLIPLPSPYLAILPSFFSALPSVSSLVIFSFFSHSTLPLSLHHVIPVTPSCFHPSLYSYPSSLISSVFLSPVMLSSLPSYPSCLISSHSLLVLSSISLFVTLVTLLTAYHTQFCVNSVPNAIFKKPTSLCSQTTLSF